MTCNISSSYQAYVQDLELRLKELYAVSERARSVGFDPCLSTECTVAKDIADLVEGLV